MLIGSFLEKFYKFCNFTILQVFDYKQIRWVNSAARGEYGFQNVWTVDGKILYKVDDTPVSKPAVYYQ